jgi:hypothetical protein
MRKFAGFRPAQNILAGGQGKLLLLVVVVLELVGANIRCCEAWRKKEGVA